MGDYSQTRVLTMSDIQNAFGKYTDVSRFSIHNGVMVIWDEDTDKRILSFIDMHERYIHPWLLVARERKGCLDFIWSTYIPPAFASGLSPYVVGDSWTVDVSITADEIGQPVPNSDSTKNYAEHRIANEPSGIPESVKALAAKYSYNLEAIKSSKMNLEPATWKQLKFIHTLANTRRSAFCELAELVTTTWNGEAFTQQSAELEWSEWEHAGWSKADAAFIIQSLKAIDGR